MSVPVAKGASYRLGRSGTPQTARPASPLADAIETAVMRLEHLLRDARRSSRPHYLTEQLIDDVFEVGTRLRVAARGGDR